jgi:hypothetical protein
VKKGGYLAMLEKAKEVQKSKPASPPIKHERTKILTKEERLALRAEAKGKKPAGPLATRSKSSDLKSDAKGDVKDRRKSVDTGYQGTARPAKKPIEIAYKGTARPAAGAAGGKANGVGTSKTKAKQSQGRYGGYGSWSEEEDEEEEEEEGYESSDMEAGIWDVEQEDQLALKAAKQEDATELAKEIAMKRAKEERKRKLLNLSKAAAAKRKY